MGTYLPLALVQAHTKGNKTMLERDPNGEQQEEAVEEEAAAEEESEEETAAE